MLKVRGSARPSNSAELSWAWMLLSTFTTSAKIRGLVIWYAWLKTVPAFADAATRLGSHRVSSMVIGNMQVG